ncbi:MAG TPA: sodium/glutamate symporter, partial [Clostridia bacterium]|nr:sodium/glutamate symporter [Clostridia bacterium]
LGMLSGLILLGNLLRRKIGFLKKTLLPTSLIAGFLALGFRYFKILPLDQTFMEAITYHTIAIGFIALALRIPKRDKIKEGSPGDGVKSGALIVSTYLLQGLLGLAITVILSYTLSPGLFKAAGILLPMGYGQGPGQANNIGTAYETGYGFEGGASFGLALATTGFLWACLGGVVYMNILAKKQKIKLSEIKGKNSALSISEVQDENEIPLSESIDRLSMQIAMVLFIYLLTYLFSLGLTSLFDNIPALSGASKTISPLIWGFNFLIGTLIAILARGVFGFLRKANIMTHQYPNSFLLNRLSGFSFDLMIVSSICAIEISDLSGLWIPFILLTIFGGIVTLIYLIWICKYLYPKYYYKGFLSMYGMLTGTISTGMLLLREVDPQFETPATNNLILGSTSAIVLGMPMLLLIGIAPKSIPMLILTFACLIVYLAVLVAFMLKGKRVFRRKHTNLFRR